MNKITRKADPPQDSFQTPTSSDAERYRVAALLEKAAADGRLTLDEFEVRIGAVYAARTRAELDAAARDLVDWQDGSPAAKRPRHAMPRVLVVIWTAWASVVLINFAIWGMLTVALGGGVHPWPLWIAIPPGMALLGVTAITKVAR